MTTINDRICFFLKRFRTYRSNTRYLIIWWCICGCAVVRFLINIFGINVGLLLLLYIFWKLKLMKFFLSGWGVVLSGLGLIVVWLLFFLSGLGVWILCPVLTIFTEWDFVDSAILHFILIVLFFLGSRGLIYS